MQLSMVFYQGLCRGVCTATRPDVALCAAARLDNRIHTAVSVVSHAVAASLAVALISLSGLALLFLQLLAQMQLSMRRLCISSGFPGCCTFCLLPRCISLRCALVVLSGPCAAVSAQLLAQMQHCVLWFGLITGEFTLPCLRLLTQTQHSMWLLGFL